MTEYMKTDNGKDHADCLSHDALLFVQIPCTFDPEELNERQVQGLFIGCMGVFIALFFVVYVDYMRSVFKNSFVEWDVKTITAGDYSVELDIPEALYKKFLEQKYDPLSGKTKIEGFRDFLQHELEERLTNLPDLGYEEQAPDRIRISMISFAFDNAKLINLLRERGNYIKFEKYDKMREVNAKIDALKGDPKSLTLFNRPVTAFLTFENEEGLNRCKNYDETVMNDNQYRAYRDLLGESLNFEDASEPTDIIWENRRFTAFERFQRTIIVICCVALLLFISFMFIFVCSKKASLPVLQYPTTQCEETTEIYGTNLEKLSIQEYLTNKDSLTPDDVQY